MKKFQGLMAGDPRCIDVQNLGFELDEAYFYVLSSNQDHVAQFGSTLSTSTISIYPNSDSNQAFCLGVDGPPKQPKFWISSHTNHTPQFVVVVDPTTKVGVGTQSPSCTLDVWGDVRIRGQLFSLSSNIVINNAQFDTRNIEVETISGLGSNHSISFLDSIVNRILSLQVNSNVGIGTLSTSLNSNYALDVWGPTRFSSNVTLPTLYVQNISSSPNQYINFLRSSACNLQFVQINSNVGIGTSSVSPTYRLDVWGDVRFSNSLLVPTVQVSTMQGTGSSQVLNFANSAASNLRTLQVTCNIGVGTTNPSSQYKLDVWGDVRFTNTLIAPFLQTSSILGTGSNQVINFNASYGNNFRSLQLTCNIGIGTTPSSLYAIDTIGDARLSGTLLVPTIQTNTILGTGSNQRLNYASSYASNVQTLQVNSNVGIGTYSITSPYALDVWGDARFSNLVNVPFLRTPSISSPTSVINFQASYASNVQTLQVSSNVGIGTTKPSSEYVLDVWGDVRFSNVLNVPLMKTTSLTTPYVSGGSNHTITFAGDYLSNIQTLQVSSNVGIGTSIPSSQYALDVWGDTRLPHLHVATIDGISSNHSIDFVGTSFCNVQYIEVLSNVTIGHSNNTTSNDALQVYGNIHVEGDISACNIDGRDLFIETIKGLGDHQTIDITNSTLSNVHQLQVNCNVEIGGETLMKDVVRHVMGNMQDVRTAMGHVMYNTSNLVEFGFIVSWPNEATEFDFFEVKTDFFAVGHATRMHMEYTSFINSLDAPPDFPLPDDIIQPNILVKSSNIDLFIPNVERFAARSLKVGVQWQISNLIPHAASMRIDVFAPMTLGPMTFKGYQILQNYLYTYDYANGVFINPILVNENEIMFTDSVYLYGTIRYVVGMMQRLLLVAHHATYSFSVNQLGYLLDWQNNTPYSMALMKGEFFTDVGTVKETAQFTCTFPTASFSNQYNTSFASRSLYASSQWTSVDATSAKVGFQWGNCNLSPPSHEAAIVLDVLTPESIGMLEAYPFKGSSNASNLYYYDAGTSNYLASPNVLPPLSYIQNVNGVQRHKMGNIETIHTQLGNVEYNTTENELGFIVSWVDDFPMTTVEVESTFFAIGDNATRMDAESTDILILDGDNTIKKGTSHLSTAKSLNVSTLSTFSTMIGPNQFKVCVRWTLNTPFSVNHRANLKLMVKLPMTAGRLEVAGYRSYGNTPTAMVTDMYNEATKSFTTSTIPISMPDATGPAGVITGVMRQIVNGMQHITCTFGNIEYITAGTNRVGFNFKWTQPQDYGFSVATEFYSIGLSTDTYMSLKANHIVYHPNVVDSITTSMETVTSPSVKDACAVQISNQGSTEADVFVTWTLQDAEVHRSTLRMQITAPLSMGEITVKGFYYDS